MGLVSTLKTYLFFPINEQIYLREILKSQIFHDTIKESVWLKYQDFSPGSWAVDYGLLYTLYRVLNDVHPQNILEFGLGQSSKMIYQYVSFNEDNDTNAITVEHDGDWIDFFMKNIQGRYNLNVSRLQLESVFYKNKFKTYFFSNLRDLIGEKKFDCILIDAPYGTERFSRCQIIDYIPTCLADNFCIIIDDYNRRGEKDTAMALCAALYQANIPYQATVLYGIKEHYLICSEKWKFLTTIG